MESVVPLMPEFPSPAEVGEGVPMMPGLPSPVEVGEAGRHRVPTVRKMMQARRKNFFCMIDDPTKLESLALKQVACKAKGWHLQTLPSKRFALFDSQVTLVLDLQEPAEKITNLLDLSHHHQDEISAL
jgi:hypothetical protein